MASIAQLRIVSKVEKDREELLHQQFLEAKQHLFANQQKLSALEQYRLDYLSLIKQKASEGLAAKALIQHQSFVGKLDKACQQQVEIINQAVLVQDQRKRQWLTQQTKSQAIIKLIEKQSKKESAVAAKQEQKLFDELSSLAHYKRSISGS